MTLTSPGCPAGPQIMGDVERAVKAVPGVSAVKLNLVWDPFWTPDKIEPRVRAYMGL
jgi:metal-sulfur cluster biosynthetic enzyme